VVLSSEELVSDQSSELEKAPKYVPGGGKIEGPSSCSRIDSISIVTGGLVPTLVCSELGCDSPIIVASLDVIFSVEQSPPTVQNEFNVEFDILLRNLLIFGPRAVNFDSLRRA